MEFAIIVLIAVLVVYKLGLFEPVLDLKAVAVREAARYNLDHTKKVANHYLKQGESFTPEEVTKINANIKALRDLKFD